MNIELLHRLVQPILDSEGLELVDIEYKKEGKKFILRIFIDKEGGIIHDDCQNVSEQVSAVLDVEDVIPHPYMLEVSSPGLERPLKKLDDFRRFAGRKVKIRLFKALEGEKNITGFIDGVTGDKIIIHEPGTGTGIHISHRDVAKATLVFEFASY